MKTHHRFWPARLPHAISTPNTSLWDNLDTSARRFPNKTALIFLGTPLSYADLKAQVDTLAAHLQSLGVQKGDRVVLNMQNCPQLVIAHFAILRANAVVVPVNPMNRAEELKHYITDPDARVALTTADLAADLASASNQLPAGQGLAHMVVTHFTDAFDPKVTGDDAPPPAWHDWLFTRHALPTLNGGEAHSWQDALACTATPGPVLVGPEDLAVLPYTSGTTGLPKGCMHPHRTLMHNAIAASMWGNGTHENVSLLAVPMFHITGMTTVMHAGIYLGATLVLMPRWERELAGRLISKWQVTHWTNIPTMVIDLLASPNFDKFNLKSLVSIAGGGAAMPQAVAQRLFELYGLRYAEGYGLTETSPVVSVNTFESYGRKYGTVGVVIPSVEVKLAEDNEILCKGPNVMLGYYKQPALTAEVLKDGWFYTGDIGTFVENNTILKLTDRKKEMFKTSGGKYVAPQVIENKFKESPFIEQMMVIGADRKFISALIVPSLTNLKNYFEDHGLAWPVSTAELLKHERVQKLMDQQLHKFNEHFNHTEQIKKYALLPQEWTVDTGEITPTLKLKRKVIMEKYCQEIEAIYQ